MINITEKIYQEHDQIQLVQAALETAKEETSAIPPVALTIPGMSGLIYRRFINNYIRLLEQPRYLEIGVWQGSSLCAAIAGIDNIVATGVDNYSESYPHYSTTPEQDAHRNIDTVKTATAQVQLLNQSFESFDPALYAPYNVYFYDGWHEEEHQYQGIVRVAPHLEDISLVIVDDWNDNAFFEVEYKGVKYPSREKAGTYRALDDANLEILYKIEVETGENPMFPSPWHNGYGIFLVKNKNS